MVDQLSIQTVGILLTGISLTVAVIYYTFTIRNQNRSRKGQLLMGLYETYRSPEFRTNLSEVISQEWEDFDDFWEKYGIDTNPEAWVKWLSVVSYFHGIGVLLKQGLIDIVLVEELLVNIIFISWLRMGPIVEGFRDNVAGQRFDGLTSSSRYDSYSGFDYLYNELRKREPKYSEIRT